MGILGQEEVVYVPTAADGVKRIKRTCNQICEQVNSQLNTIRNIVKRYGRSEVIAELGDDASELVSFYTAAKNLIENHPDISTEDL